jgi:hypothetical protein
VVAVVLVGLIFGTRLGLNGAGSEHFPGGLLQSPKNPSGRLRAMSDSASDEGKAGRVRD